MSENVATALLNEIIRVSSIIEDWKGYAKRAEGGPHGGAMSFAPGIAMMTAEVNAAKEALHYDDATLCIKWLIELRKNTG